MKTINMEMHKLIEWLKSNKLHYNYIVIAYHKYKEPGGDNLVKGVQCYELFGGIALKNHTFSFFSFSLLRLRKELSYNFLILIYYTILLPYLKY